MESGCYLDGIHIAIQNIRLFNKMQLTEHDERVLRSQFTMDYTGFNVPAYEKSCKKLCFYGLLYSHDHGFHTGSIKGLWYYFHHQLKRKYPDPVDPANHIKIVINAIT